ncbi:MAG: hypothetical protein ACPGXX_19440 [Planctomycetaceae bacterium]
MSYENPVIIQPGVTKRTISQFRNNSAVLGLTFRLAGFLPADSVFVQVLQGRGFETDRGRDEPVSVILQAPNEPTWDIIAECGRSLGLWILETEPDAEQPATTE